MLKQRLVIFLAVVALVAVSTVSAMAYDHNVDFGSDCHGESVDPVIHSAGGNHVDAIGKRGVTQAKLLFRPAPHCRCGALMDGIQLPAVTLNN